MITDVRGKCLRRGKYKQIKGVYMGKVEIIFGKEYFDNLWLYNAQNQNGVFHISPISFTLKKH